MRIKRPYDYAVDEFDTWECSLGSRAFDSFYFPILETLEGCLKELLNKRTP